MGYPFFRKARSHKSIVYTAGDISITSTTFAPLPAATQLTIPARVDDEVEFGALWSPNNSGPALDADFGFVVSGAVSSRAGGTNVYGLIGMFSPTNAFDWKGATFPRKVAAGDIVGGKVTGAFLARVEVAGTRIIRATVDVNFCFYVKNLGPAAS